ncbi:putative F-box protein At5g62060 [Rutidosis leptorrhynchoides]|uniref:putative F-box protein At5g62060 n=1 Tax=Rutidosis leptorrhynchoides TaxID=125765 RepID=UPI003A9A4E21
MVEVELCEDLLDEIIVRLPPKFILQFRCFSKSWCSRISSSNFIRKQAIHSAARARRTANVAYQVHIEKDVYKMLHGSKPEGPFLRKLNVPDIPYDPCQKYSLVFGFGYDPIADDYNIFGLSYGTLQTLLLYSTKTNAWSEIDLPKTGPPFRVLSTPACFVDGVMHWLVQNNLPNTNDSYILTFDLSSHVFDTIPLPNITPGTIYILICQGYLTLISDDGLDSSMWLRKLDDNNLECWSKPFKVMCYDVTGGGRVYHINDDQELEVPKAYNPFSGLSRKRVSSLNSCVKYEIDSYVETLALLDNENCSTNKETDYAELRDKVLEV